MIPAHAILRIAATGLHHFVKRGHPIALSKLGHSFSHLVHNTTNVISLVESRCVFEPMWYLPVQRVSKRACA